ncbi:MAG: hypothetical protein K2W95_14990 [Candidatus Obscuribacterales bacterium]|nr:hypothetical protein [Candidatus Obscuribacterales bacterium]
MKERFEIKKWAMLLVAFMFLQCDPAPATAEYSAAEADKFAAILKHNFKYWDYDHDGVLTSEELDQAIQDPSIKGEQAAALSAVKVYSRSVWKRDDYIDEFSLDQLMPFDAGSGQPTAVGKKLVSMFTTYKKKIANESPELFANGLPHIEEIKQGKTGDCYFLSTVGGLAYHSPQRIIDMIQQNTDGSFIVTFPRHRSIAVDPPTDAEMACYSDAGDDGLWLHVLEKAYAIWKNDKTRKYDLEPLDVVIHGGSGGRMLMFMTGNACVRLPTSQTSADQLRSAMTRALERQLIVNTGTKGHCLTILKYDPQSDTVTVWNPWGTDGTYSTVHQEMKHGVFQMPLSDLQKYFVSILPEHDRPWTVRDFNNLK